MKAAWYERQGSPAQVLVIGETATPEPCPGAVRIRVAASGINPGDVKKRQDAFGVGMPYPRVIPHSDGAGTIDQVGQGVAASRIGERVWCYSAQTYRPFGTAAEYVVVPSEQAVPLPDGVPFEQGACLGIPVSPPIARCTWPGPWRGVSSSCKAAPEQSDSWPSSLPGRPAPSSSPPSVPRAVKGWPGRPAPTRSSTRAALAPKRSSNVCALMRPKGSINLVEVAFDANVAVDEALLGLGGSIATFASGSATPAIPF